jgi:hypothetical protein
MDIEHTCRPRLSRRLNVIQHALRPPSHLKHRIELLNPDEFRPSFFSPKVRGLFSYSHPDLRPPAKVNYRIEVFEDLQKNRIHPGTEAKARSSTLATTSARRIPMPQTRSFRVLLAGMAAAALLAVLHADGDIDKLSAYKLLTTVHIPGGLSAFDIAWVDSEAGRFYLADRGNSTSVPKVPPRVDVISTKHNRYLFSITGFAGPNGVVTAHGGDDDELDQPNAGQLWVGDNDSTAKVVDLAVPFAVPFSISTGGTARADELAFDPRDRLILIANDRDSPPFVTFISTTSRTVKGKIVYDGLLGNPKATAGIEQPVWDGVTGRFYISIPATVAHPKGEVDEIHPTLRAITRRFPTTCGPAGLALIPGQRLITSCGDVIDIAHGTVIHTVTPTVGGDEIWFNPGDGRVYFGGGTNFISVDVVNAFSYQKITTLTVGFILPPVINYTHSVAADSELNRIFIPVANEGVKVYTDDRDNGEESDD